MDTSLVVDVSLMAWLAGLFVVTFMAWGNKFDDIGHTPNLSGNISNHSAHLDISNKTSSSRNFTKTKKVSQTISPLNISSKLSDLDGGMKKRPRKTKSRKN
jgi:hypothetical protein